MITGININGDAYKSTKDGIGTTIKFSRGEDGNVILNINNATNAQIGDVGTISGTASLTFGVTDEDDVTMFQYKHEGDSENNFKLANVEGNHYNIVGENANITSSGGNAIRTIQVDAKNSNIDLSNAGGSQFVYMSNESKDNKTILGYGSDNYIDGGKFNHVTNKGGDDRFETTYESHGAVIVGSSANETFVIGGKYGVIDGGDGNNTFEAVGLFGTDDTSSYRNIIIGGNGNDTMIDKGGYNIFFAGEGDNTYEAHGQSGIAQIGSSAGEAAGIIGSSADKTYIFSSDTVTSSTGTVYSIYDIMNRYGWTLNEFLNIYSQISESNPDSLGNHDVIDEKTMAKLEQYFINNMNKK